MELQENHNTEKNKPELDNQSVDIFENFTRCNKCGSPFTGCTCVPGDQDPENK